MKSAFLVSTVSAGTFRWGVQEGPNLHGNGWCNGATAYTKWADINGDGQDDMICDAGGNHWMKFSIGNGQYINKGLVQRGWCGHAGAITRWADINGDGKADMICDDKQARHWFQLSNGNGTWRNLGLKLTSMCSHAGSVVSYADVNGYGKSDFICDDSAGRHWIAWSRGDGSFYGYSLKMSGWCGHAGATTNWADVNGDGKADMHCDDTAGRHWIALSNGNGTFRHLGLVKAGWCGHAGATTRWADVNGDGRADMICDDTLGRHWIMASTGLGNTWQDLGLVQSGWCAKAQTQWADVNGDGNADMTCDTKTGAHWVKYTHWIN